MRARVTRLKHHAPLSVSDVILADTPLAYYRFSDAAASATAADSSGNGRTLTLNGSRTMGINSKNSRLGNCIAFVSASGFGNVGDSSPFRLTGNLTLSTWHRCATAMTNGQEIPLASLGGAGETEAANYLYHLCLEFVGGVTRMRVLHENSTGVNNDQSIALSYNQLAWNHFAVTRDVATNLYEAYVNGISAGTVGYTNDPTGGTTAVFALNRNAGTNAAADRNGEYDEWALFNTKLTAARIFEHYRAGRR